MPAKDAQAKIDELTRIENDPAFHKLPRERQAYVETLLKELTAYRHFEQALNAIADPRNVRDLNHLEESRKKLQALTVPPEYADEWAGTPALDRRRDRLEDSAIIESVYQKLRGDYQKIIQEGKQVLADADKPNLPKRAKAVLDQARQLPDPKADDDTLLPGSFRLTYRNVFSLAGMDTLTRQWDAVRKELEPFAQRADKP